MIWILAVFALIAWIDLVPLIRRRAGREITVFLFIFTTALTLAMLQGAGVEMPGVMSLLGDLMRAVHLAYPS